MYLIFRESVFGIWDSGIFDEVFCISKMEGVKEELNRPKGQKPVQDF